MLRVDTRVVDARWLGYTGVGRVARLLLTGLGELRPPGTWVVWGPDAARESTWPGAVHVPAEHSPLAWFGQRGRTHLPPGQFLALHLVRPLVRRRGTVVLAHDTIPVRWARPWVRRRAQHAFYAFSARSASAVLACSAAAAANLTRDLGVPATRIHRIEPTIDLTLAERVRRARPATGRADCPLLYVGLREPHKNLERALAAFAASALGHDGGAFRLVGAADDTIDDLRRLAAPVRGAEVFPRCSDSEPIEPSASAGALIQPSLDEGFGLTVVDGFAGRGPVCCSAGGALEEAGAGGAELFDPRSVRSMAAAIDRAVGARDWAERFDRFRAERPVPTQRELAAQVVAVLDQVAR